MQTLTKPFQLVHRGAELVLLLQNTTNTTDVALDATGFESETFAALGAYAAAHGIEIELLI